MAQLSEFEFSRMFRMGRTAFGKLLNLIKENISVNQQQAINSSGSCIPNVTRLAATLRWLAGGSYLDISFEFGLDQRNFFSKHYFLWKTIDAIDSVLKLGFSLDPTYLSNTAADFARFSKGRMTGCVLAVDGWVCATRKPTRKEVGDCVISYRNRKNCWGIIVMAGCDAKCRFSLLSAQCSGGTHDYPAWEGTRLAALLKENKLPEPYYFVGDEAFVCTNNFLVPWPGTGLGLWKDSFNYHLSSMRQCIERAFGLLTQRWGIFWRPLRCQFKKWSTVVTVAAKLHNFCIDENCPMPSGAVVDRLTPENHWRVIDNDPLPNAGDVFPHSSGNMRRDITNQLLAAGITRPPHAMTC